LGVQPISLGRGGSNKTPANNTMPLKAVPEGSKVLNRVGGGAHSAEQPARRLINTHMPGNWDPPRQRETPGLISSCIRDVERVTCEIVRLEAGEKKRREMGTKGPRTPPTIRAISECRYKKIFMCAQARTWSAEPRADWGRVRHNHARVVKGLSSCQL
jgi:hypothetical protein